MKAKLIGVSGEPPLLDIDLVLPVVLGRSRRSGFLIQHSLVSRQHCELYEQDGKLMIRDLGSMNGTCVNRVRIDEAIELLTGDLLTLGSVTFRVDCGDSRGTLSDNKDETAVAMRSDLDQLLRVPASDTFPSNQSQVATSTGETFPTALEAAESGLHSAKSEDQSDALLRNPR